MADVPPDRMLFELQTGAPQPVPIFLPVDRVADGQRVCTAEQVAHARGETADYWRRRWGLWWLSEEAADGPDDLGSPDHSLAAVVVGTRVVQMLDGEVQHQGTVTEVRAECVFVTLDAGLLLPGKPARVALRWDEFAVLPRLPAGRESEGDA